MKQFRAFYVDRYDPGQEKTLNEDELVELVKKEVTNRNQDTAVQQTLEWIENSIPGDEYECFYINWFIIRVREK